MPYDDRRDIRCKSMPPAFYAVWADVSKQRIILLRNRFAAAHSSVTHALTSAIHGSFKWQVHMPLAPTEYCLPQARMPEWDWQLICSAHPPPPRRDPVLTSFWVDPSRPCVLPAAPPSWLPCEPPHPFRVMTHCWTIRRHYRWLQPPQPLRLIMHEYPLFTCIRDPRLRWRQYGPGIRGQEMLWGRLDYLPSQQSSAAGIRTQTKSCRCAAECSSSMRKGYSWHAVFQVSLH